MPKTTTTKKSPSTLHSSPVNALALTASGSPRDPGTASPHLQPRLRPVWALRCLHWLHQRHHSHSLHSPFPYFSLNSHPYTTETWVGCLCSPPTAATSATDITLYDPGLYWIEEHVKKKWYIPDELIANITGLTRKPLKDVKTMKPTEKPLKDARTLKPIEKSTVIKNQAREMDVKETEWIMQGGKMDKKETEWIMTDGIWNNILYGLMSYTARNYVDNDKPCIAVYAKKGLPAIAPITGWDECMVNFYCPLLLSESCV